MSMLAVTDGGGLNVPWTEALNRGRRLGQSVIGIVVSHADEASTAIGEQLLAEASWTTVEPGVHRTGGFELREFDDLHIDLDDVAAEFDDPDCVVFASRHSGDTGALLSAHYTGNFGAAEYGGADRDLSTACPGAHRQVVRALSRNAPDGWDVAMECTHHGPTSVGAPAMFVELGSGPEQWQDEAGANAVARSILALDESDAEASRTVVAFGGNHYAPRPTRLILETDVAVGHVAADWSLEALGIPAHHPEVVDAMFESSGAECAVFDGDHPEVEAVVEDLGYRVVSETWIRETAGRSMDLVDGLETALSTVDEGLRFGTVRAGDRDVEDLVVRALPTELLATCNGIDPDETRRAMERTAVAFETAEGGTLVDGAAAFTSEEAYQTFVEDAMAVLEAKFDSVDREDGAVVVERAAFDPAAAAEAGVPEGPKFGRLAAGEAVTVDGDIVDPDRVRSHERREFPV